MGVAGSLFIASILALRYLISRKPGIGSAAVVLVVTTLVGFVALVPAGVAMLMEVENSGNDYTGLGAVGCFALGVVFPGMMGVVTTGGGACLLVVRRQINRYGQ
jgi:hypothetical protein